MDCILVLRGINHKDLARLRQWRSDRSLRNLTHGFRYPTNEAMERSWYEDKIINGAPNHAIFAIQSTEGIIIGVAQLSPIDTISRHAKLGIYLSQTQERGKGIGARALHELLIFGFKDLNLNKIFLEVTASNSAAIKLYKKAGFSKEGVLKSHYYLEGEMVDVAIYSLFSDEFV